MRRKARLLGRKSGLSASRPRYRRIGMEVLEPRRLLDAGALLISEFMASNDGTLADADGEASDWIEIYNPGPEAVHLENWHLTDDPDDLSKWDFPDCLLAANDYLVVFASNKNRRDPAAELHTNFKLSAPGEYLALVEPDAATIAHEFAPEYAGQFADVSYGLGSTKEVTPLVDSQSELRALVPADDALGDGWTDPALDDSGWTSGTRSIGYETEAGYQPQIDLDLKSSMFGANASAYVRIPFEVDDPAAVDQLSLRMKYDDAFAAYLNGQEIASRNTAPAGGESPPQGLVGYWGFEGDLRDWAGQYDNHSGTTADDLSVQAGGSVRFVPGILGSGIALDAIPGDALSLSTADSPDTRLGPIYTIESWIYPTNLYSWGRFVLNWAGAGNSYHFALRNGNQVSLFHAQANGTNRNADSASLVQLGDAAGWQHIAGVADGNRLRVYYNGQEVGSTSYDGTIHSVTQGLGIGDSPPGGSGAGLRYQGYLDELAIWNVVLTPEQILSHYQAGERGYGLAGGGGVGTELTWNSAATQQHPDAEAVEFESIDVTAHLDSLRAGTNVLAIQGLNLAADDPDFLIAAELDAIRLLPQADFVRYFAVPTPGAANGVGTANLGPLIRDVPQSTPKPADGEDVPITALVAETGNPVASVSLHYRVMFGSEINLAMFDDGQHGDGAAGDGVFGAEIPATASRPGEMVRWYVTAEDTAGQDSRWPLFEDPIGSPEYFGTVIADPSVTTEVSVFDRFIAPGNLGAAETGSGTRSSVYYGGEFYDNVFIRIRGGTARNWPKKSYKLKFNDGYDFRFKPDQERVDEININATYTDKSYVRAILAYETHRDAGGFGPETFAIRMQQNGDFHSVALFVEQPQKAFLRRHDLRDDGALYKALQITNGLTGSATRGIDKKFPKDGDFSDLQALINGLALSGTARERFLFDNVNLPAQINFMAVNVILQNIDATDKNYFIYRDTFGTGEWQMLPWDLDLIFGPNALNTDRIEATDDGPSDHTSHPLLGGLRFPFHGRKNHLFDAIFNHSRTRQMFVRRVRTLMDQFLDPADPHFERRIDQLVDLLGPDVLLDKAEWRGNAHFGNTDYTLQQAANRIKNEYLARRRTHLFTNHNAGNLGYPNNAGIPDGQIDLAALPPEGRGIEIGTIEFAPASGNQDEEYIEILNHNSFAVDLSGWQLTEAVEHTLRPGTVIPAAGSLYVTPSAKAFRSRSNGPGGGQGLFVQDGVSGHLSSFGETVRLVNAGGAEITSTTYTGDPSATQQHLRISEIMYHPLQPTAEEIAAGFRSDDHFEYIELANVGPETLDLQDVHFSRGVEFAFSTVTLDPGEQILVVQNRTAFQLRYGLGPSVAGEFTSGRLSNGGEELKLEDPLGGTIQQFAYDDAWPWPKDADGEGPSLEAIDTAGDYGDPTNWRAGCEYLGSPGFDGVEPLGDVVINEVVSQSDEPQVDWIELHNPTHAAIDVGGWYLSDTSDDFRKYRIPTGITIPAGGYLVFDENQFNLPPQTADFALNSAHGDDVWLLEADVEGKLTRFVDHVEFDASAPGESFGRWPNGTGTLYPMVATAPGAANRGPRIGPVILSEVMYHPTSSVGGIDVEDFEFVEVSNPTTAAIILTNWQLGGGIAFAFAAASELGPGASLVVVPFDVNNQTAAAAFREHYGIDENVALAGPYSGKLANNGEIVRLLRPGAPPPDELEFIPALLEDEIIYDDALPWPAEPDGDGASLSRRAPVLWGRDSESWTATQPNPGRANLYAHPGDANLDAITDVRDFNIWNAHKFTSGTSWEQGDFNFDGVTDVRDFNIWNAHKFTSAPAPAPVDAALEEALTPDHADSAANLVSLAWLYDVEPANAERRPSDNACRTAAAVDKLLATYWAS